MIKQAVFDFGGVVVRWQPEDVIAKLYAGEPERALIRSEIFRHPDWLELDRGTLEGPEAVARFSGRTGRPPAEIAVLLEQVRDSLTPIPETVALLQELAQRKLPLFGLSNMPAATFDHMLRRDEHWSLFRGIVISGRVKLLKPEPAIFQHLCATYGLAAAETVFIDDHEPNVTSAARLGFQVIHFRSAQQCREQLLALLHAGAAPPA